MSKSTNLLSGCSTVLSVFSALALCLGAVGCNNSSGGASTPKANAVPSGTIKGPVTVDGTPIYEIGKTYWFSGATGLRDKNGTYRDVDSNPVKAKLLGFHKITQTPIIEVAIGPAYGTTNSCYFDDRSNIFELCNDTSKNIKFVDPSEMRKTELYKEPKRGVARAIGKMPLAGRQASTPENEDLVPYRLRLADSHHDLSGDFRLGQNLTERSDVYESLDVGNFLKYANQFEISFKMGFWKIRTGDELEVYGKENIAGNTFYIVKAFESNKKPKAKFSEIFILVEPANVSIVE